MKDGLWPEFPDVPVNSIHGMKGEGDVLGVKGKRTKERTCVEYHVWMDAHNLPRTYQLLS